MNRRITREIRLGNVLIGGDNPVSIQSMCNTHTQDVAATVSQILLLEKAGCEIIRVAVPDIDAALAIKEIKKQINIPLIADIHFDYRLAIQAVESGVDGLRLNPGNIGSYQNVLAVVDVLKEKQIPVRIGVNSGSLSKEKITKYGVTAEAIIESALEHVTLLEKAGYEEIKISVKASSVPLTIESYRLLSKKVNYPLHLGVTEAGTTWSGTIKSAVGIGTMLAEGIGDTIRVSLTADPVEEVYTAKEILKSLNLRQGLNIISCPTCGRTEIELIRMAEEVRTRLEKYADKPLTIAVMGCVVNGPGEAREADFGLAGGKGEGLIFRKGEIIKKVQQEHLVDELVEIIENQFPNY